MFDLRRQKQVRLTVFDNEPVAKLAEQRLQQAGIPCFIRCLRGGPGLWGSAYNLPHDLYVYESDETRARDVLEMPPLGLPEREARGAPPRPGANLRLVLTGLIIVVLVLGFLVPLIFRASE